VTTRAAAVLLALVTALAAAGCKRAERPPNVILITLDTTRPDHLGVYGYGGATSPNLDRFAEGATVYRRAYATSSWTLPTHASMFTGLYPMQHGAQSVPQGPNKSLGYGVRPLQDSFVTLAELLKDAGYRTGAVIAGPALRAELGVAQGFENYDDEFTSAGEKFTGRRAEKVTDIAIEMIDSFGDAPYFLFVNFFDAHAPYRPPAPYSDVLGPPPTKEQAQAGIDTLKGFVAKLDDGAEPVAVDRLAPAYRESMDAQLAGYDAEIRYMDHHLGRLLDTLLAGREGERTLVVITADHGESFGEHYFFSHGASLYEDNVRVPLIVRYPGQSRSREVETAAQNHRVFATILREAGVAAPDGPASVTLEDAPPTIVLQVKRSESNVKIFGEFFERDLISIVEWPRKLIESSRGKTELFSLDKDPQELVNLTTVDADAAAQLSKSLADFAGAHPPLFDADDRAELRKDTVEALKAMGYLD